MEQAPSVPEASQFEPLLSVARAVLGPQVQIHGTVIRVTYPGQRDRRPTGTSTSGSCRIPCHRFSRGLGSSTTSSISTISTRRPVLYASSPGPTSGYMRSCQRSQYDSKPGQVMLQVRPVRALRQMRACGTVPCRLCPRTGAPARHLGLQSDMDEAGGPPRGGLTDTILPGADVETRELLGLSGWF